MKKNTCIIWFLLSFIIYVSYAQNEYTIMTYNILNYPANDAAIRNAYFRTVIANTQPDILVVQEILSQAGVDGFLNNVLNVASSGYAAGIFLNGPDTDNAIFYKSDKFFFISNTPIHTELRDISEFTMVCIATSDTIRIYSLHLKASQGSSNEQQRAREVDSLRKVTNALTPNSNFIIVGDFNIYYSSEPAFQKLLNQTNSGYVIDPLNLVGTWNDNPNYALFHTQSPRTRSFNGGSTGGMDDRFDMILLSQAVKDSGGIFFIDNSYINYGNDGLHFNDSINRPPNTAVGQQIADALHYASDHIPVLATFRFEQNTTQIAVEINNGWNILSAPLLAEDMKATTLFPTAVSSFYSFSGIYNEVNVLENGKGYWAKFNGNQMVTITGTFLTNNTINVNQGWNLIGPFSTEVPISSITTVPPGIIQLPIYVYNGSYIAADSLMPGKGYWVKCSASGTIFFNSANR